MNIKELIQQGEGISVEFKRCSRKLPDSFFETVCAFLNRNGGTVLLGVSDDKKIEGVPTDIIEDICKSIANLSNNPQKLYPTFLLSPIIVDYEGVKLITVYVPSSSQVHRTVLRYYDRSVDGDYELRTDEQIKALYTRKNNLFSENTIYPYLFETDFEPGIVMRVRQMIRNNRSNHPWNDLSNEDFFRTSGLYRSDLATGKEGFTLAALLLFGKSEAIQSAIPHYKVDALLRIKDLDRYDDRENIRCNLVDMYDKLMQFIEKHLPDKFYLEGNLRISLRDKIFREVIANILIHREYSNAFPTLFCIYKNYAEAMNANKPRLHGVLTPHNLLPYPKNPTIAQIFTQMGRSEELGTGIRNVFKYSKAYSGSDKVVFSEEDVFITQIPLMNVTENISLVDSELIDKTLVKSKVKSKVKNKDLNKDKIIQLLKENNNISIIDMAQLTQISISGVEKIIRQLKVTGIIERIGPNNGGYWKVNID